MYKIVYTDTFEKQYKKLTFHNLELKNRVKKTLRILSEVPYYPSLITHKVISRDFGEVLSSRVTGDIRIIWEFNSYNRLVINALAVGAHTGNNRVYN